jgi:predicted ATPase
VPSGQCIYDRLEAAEAQGDALATDWKVVMIQSVGFKNFKVLKNATLILEPFTLIVGPNGSGKTTALKALQLFPRCSQYHFDQVATVGLDPNESVELSVTWSSSGQNVIANARWSRQRGVVTLTYSLPESGSPLHESDPRVAALLGALSRMEVYTLDAQALAAAVPLKPSAELASDGGQLAAVLDRLRDESPERFEALNRELGHWFPEYDRILFETPGTGRRAFQLRTARGRHAIPASELSQGTLLALALLTLAHSASPRPLICLEEPDRGIHPRLLRDVQDALYRLSYPQNFSEERAPVQVIATTHSPYVLDLYKEHPEEIVIAHKDMSGARFERLSDLENLLDLLKDSHLGEVWYSGILGGVPAEG